MRLGNQYQFCELHGGRGGSSFRSVPPQFRHLIIRAKRPPRCKRGQCCARCRWRLSNDQPKVDARKSTLPGAGKGLFALRRRGDLLTAYGGTIQSKEQIDELDDKQYVLHVKASGQYIDGKQDYDEKEEMGRWINMAEKAREENVKFRWVTTLKRSKQEHAKKEDIYVGVFAKRTICAGEEVFVSYGNRMVK